MRSRLLHSLALVGCFTLAGSHCRGGSAVLACYGNAAGYRFRRHDTRGLDRIRK